MGQDTPRWPRFASPTFLVNSENGLLVQAITCMRFLTIGSSQYLPKMSRLSRASSL